MAVLPWRPASLPTRRTPQTPKTGGTLTYAVTAEAPSTDCHATTTYAAMHVLAPHYSLLLKVDPGQLSQAQARCRRELDASRRTASTYTFKMRAGVVFHDGTPLTSKDVKATFDRIRNPPDGIVSIRKELFADIASIDTPDPATVVMRLKAPDASFLDTLALPYNCIYSADRLAQDANFPAKTVMGSGPFVFVEHRNGSHWIGKRFDKYWEKGKPYLDGFRAVFIKSQAVVTALQGGQIQAEFRSISPGERNAARQQPQGQDHGAGGALGVQGRPAVQHRGQALRQPQGPPGPVDGHRSLGRLGGAVQDHHPQAGRRAAAAGLADRARATTS